MRWDRLFDDLESQLEQELGAEEVDLAVEEERLRLGRIGLRDRLAATTGPAPIVIETASGAVLALRAEAVGRDWIAGRLAGEGVRGRIVIPLAAVAAVRLAGEQLAAGLAAEPAASPSLSARLGLAFVLRDLCRRRTAVVITTGRGALHGTIDRVARDHLDLAEHDADQPRRATVVRGTRIVPFAQLDSLRYG